MDGGREGGRPERHDDFGEELAVQEEGKKKGPNKKEWEGYGCAFWCLGEGRRREEKEKIETRGGSEISPIVEEGNR